MRLSKTKRDRIAEQILSHLYHNFPVSFFTSSMGKRLEMFGDSVSFVGDVLSSVDKEVLEQKISYRDAIHMLIQRSTKINI